MKKFIIIATCLILLYLGLDTAYYRLGWYVDLHPDRPVTAFMTTEGKEIRMKDPITGQYEPFEIKGVNMGAGKPGEWATSLAIDKETYLRWFDQIAQMGANTIRVYTIQPEDFYEAFYEFNSGRERPLYLLHGVWVDDYVQNSHLDAYADEFFETFKENCRNLVDVLHGRKKLNLRGDAGSGSYYRNVSEWVIGYIIGVEWEDVTVAYTNEKYEGLPGYTEFHGKYLYTAEEASPFEVMLAQVGDDMIGYESKRYKEQRLLAYANWNTTDPFEWEGRVQDLFRKCASVDVEHIKATEEVLSGQFASYHSYPYYPDYLAYEENWEQYGVDKTDFALTGGKTNTYRAYLKMLTDHHTIPVVISEFGVSTGRGIAQRERSMGRNQGHMSERGQGDAIVSCWEDIQTAGCAGGCIFTWQDEWFKRTWNTMYAVDLKRTPYWSDYQTNEQYFGLLSFDPGKEESVCYVDGDVSEWSESDLVTEEDGLRLSMKYDEKFLYFLVQKDGLDFRKDTIYLPFDITPKTGSSYCLNYDIAFERAADFLLVLNGRGESRLQVQERYESLRANYAKGVYLFDTYTKEFMPEADSPQFVNIGMILQLPRIDMAWGFEEFIETNFAEIFETGRLVYGNANPESGDFNSLADFISEGDYIEIRLPWQLFNFADPSSMEIHDDYYDGNYGVRYIGIDRMYVGIAEKPAAEEEGLAADRIPMTEVPLEGWGRQVTYHERLKSSYYIVQDMWRENRE